MKANSNMTHTADPVVVFDGHNDTLLRLELASARSKAPSFFDGEGSGHIDFKKARKGHLSGGLFAMFTPSRVQDNDVPAFNGVDPRRFQSVDQPTALDFTMRLFARAKRLARESEDAIRVCLTAHDIEEALRHDKMAMVHHIEGAEAIDLKFDALETFYAAGLRSLGPVWSRPNAFGNGAPMKLVREPEPGGSLTDAGVELVKACNDLKIMIDLSHLTIAGFWDVAHHSDSPLVASHSNAWRLSPSARNLTDEQLHAIRERNGFVGVNFNVGFLRNDCRSDRNTAMSHLVRQFDYLVEQMGEDCVGIGSDFDGAITPNCMANAGYMQDLVQAFRHHGFGESLIGKICHKNWIRVLRQTWGE